MEIRLNKGWSDTPASHSPETKNSAIESDILESATESPHLRTRRGRSGLQKDMGECQGGRMGKSGSEESEEQR